MPNEKCAGCKEDIKAGANRIMSFENNKYYHTNCRPKSATELKAEKVSNEITESVRQLDSIERARRSVLAVRIKENDDAISWSIKLPEWLVKKLNLSSDKETLFLNETKFEDEFILSRRFEWGRR